MSVRKVILKLAATVADEADQNPRFAKKLEEILATDSSSGSSRAHPRTGAPVQGKARHRRTPAVLDPVAIVKDGEDALRSRLASLDLDQLRDIVAEHGMDQGRLVMRWKTPERIIDKIVEISIGRARKGEAFRS